MVDESRSTHTLSNQFVLLSPLLSNATTLENSAHILSSPLLPTPLTLDSAPFALLCSIRSTRWITTASAATMPASADLSIGWHFTATDDSLSELSDASQRSSCSSSKSSIKAKPASLRKLSSTSALQKPASTSNVAKSVSNSNAKHKARKSETAPPSTAKALSTSDKAKGKRKMASTRPGTHADADQASPKPNPNPIPPRTTPVSDAIRARTHVNVVGGPQKLCHQHHQNCKGALLECTFMRTPEKRCLGRYCFFSLKRFYDQDPEVIVMSNRMMINPAEHCPPSETKYAWKCPKCRGKCVCSICRKAVGLEPLGRPFGSKRNKDGTIDTADQVKSKNTQPKANAHTAAQGAPAKAKTKANTNNRTIADTLAAPPKPNGQSNSKSDAATEPDDADDGICTLPLPVSKPKTTIANMLSTDVARAPPMTLLKPPTQVAPPVFEVIPTKLPHDNLRARMWIYESMVRFDKFGLSKSVLNQLDRFEHWTHALVQDMLACLIKTISGMTNIDKGQPAKPFVKIISSFRTYGRNLERGEPWFAATELLAKLGFERKPLSFVEHNVPVEVEVAAAAGSPSPPPAARVTRARRAKESNQYETARQLSLLDRWQDDELDEMQSDAYDDDHLPSKRRRATTKKSIYVYDDFSDEDSMADPDERTRDRRSGRARKAVQKEVAPEIRLTGRQQAIKLQQEQQKEEEAAAAKQRQEDQQEARQVEACRKRRLSDDSGGAGITVIDISDDEDGQTDGRSQNKRRKFAVASSDNGIEVDHDGSDRKDARNGAEANAKNDVRVEQEMESADLETKISILAALIDAAIMADSVAEELKLAADNIVALEREQKAANVEMEKEMVEELAQLNKRAPSIVSREYQEWKVEKAQMELDHAWRRQDARVLGELAIDTHALRTGPLGVDVDGREYWHLREFQERMPKYTEGRYAWCLVVLGAAFSTESKQAQRNVKGQDQADVSTADRGGKQDEQNNETDDSGFTLLDTWPTSDQSTRKVKDKDGDRDIRLGLPISSICMGTNNPGTIQSLIEYLRFRLERVEYEENVSMQQRERAARGNGFGATNGATAGDGNAAGLAGTESMYSVRKAKQTLKDTQEERRKQVEQLMKRLSTSKEYFAWHREEVAP